MTIIVKTKGMYEHTKVFSDVKYYDYNETTHELIIQIYYPEDVRTIINVKHVEILDF